MPSDSRDEIAKIAARNSFLEKSRPYILDRIGTHAEMNYFNHCGILFEIVQYDLNILDRYIIDFGSFPLFISNFLSVLGIYVMEDSIFGDLYFVRKLIHSRMVSFVCASFHGGQSGGFFQKLHTQ
jgi:hypothetical protein